MKKTGGWIVFILIAIIAWLPPPTVKMTPETWLETIALLIAWGYAAD